jgi:hypothetical protein
MIKINIYKNYNHLNYQAKKILSYKNAFSSFMIFILFWENNDFFINFFS